MAGWLNRWMGRQADGWMGSYWKSHIKALRKKIQIQVSEDDVFMKKA